MKNVCKQISWKSARKFKLKNNGSFFFCWIFNKICLKFQILYFLDSLSTWSVDLTSNFMIFEIKITVISKKWQFYPSDSRLHLWIPYGCLCLFSTIPSNTKQVKWRNALHVASKWRIMTGNIYWLNHKKQNINLQDQDVSTAVAPYNLCHSNPAIRYQTLFFSSHTRASVCEPVTCDIFLNTHISILNTHMWNNWDKIR